MLDIGLDSGVDATIVGALELCRRHQLVHDPFH